MNNDTRRTQGGTVSPCSLASHPYTNYLLRWGVMNSVAFATEVALVVTEVLSAEIGNI